MEQSLQPAARRETTARLEPADPPVRLRAPTTPAANSGAVALTVRYALATSCSPTIKYHSGSH